VTGPLAPSTPGLLDRTFLTNVPDVVELMLVRHGQQERAPGRGRAATEPRDPPLSETGREQADLVGAGLAGRRLDAVYCSTLQRAADTARAIAGHHDLAPVVHEEFREVEVFRDVPDGKTITDVASKLLLRGANRRFAGERRWDVFPFSETGAELRARVVSGVEGILAGHGPGRVAVVCHGGVINSYLAHVLGLDVDMFFHPAHASVSRVLAQDGRRVVHTMNETHHLTRNGDDGLVTY